tara:strand:+ start:147 stop:617 length:471 start_codon:yes stop_codon:yes gene_type:complete
MFRKEWRVFKHWRLSVHFYRAHPVDGVNSETRDGQHVLMWDFDNTDYFKVAAVLRLAQDFYDLPPIYILESSPGGYHAYCFASQAFPQALAVVGLTPGIDKVFLAISTLRGYFTLRMSDKKGGILKLAGVLDSDIPEEVDPVRDMVSFTKYWTRKG